MVARAFTPSRSAIYGSPERRAAGDFAGQVLGILGDLSDFQIEAEDRRQISNANIALMKEKRAIKDRMANSADSPDKWLQDYKESRQKVYDGVMSGVTQPGARNAIESKLNEELESWNDWIKDESEKQSGINTNTDYELGRSAWLEDRKYSSPEEVFEHIQGFITHEQVGWNGGDKPVDRFPTEAAYTESVREGTEQILGNYIMQAPDAEEILKDPNAYFGIISKSVLGKDASIFSPTDIAKLKSQYKTRKAINEADAKKAIEIREAEVETKAREFAVKGDFGSGIDSINGALGELGPDWHSAALTKYQNAFRIMNTTGENPFTKTQSWSKFQEVRDGILNKTVKSEKEIRSYTGLKDGYAIPQEKYLLDLYNGDGSSAKTFEESAAAQNLIALTKDIADPSESDEVELSQFVIQRGLSLLQDFIENKPDATDREKKEAALRIGRHLQQEDDAGLLESVLENTIRGPLPKGARITKTATNPKTGKRIGWNGTKWIPIQ